MKRLLNSPLSSYLLYSVALEKTSSRVHPGIPSSNTTGGMPVLTSDHRPKKALFKKLKTLVKKKKI